MFPRHTTRPPSGGGGATGYQFRSVLTLGLCSVYARDYLTCLERHEEVNLPIRRLSTLFPRSHECDESYQPRHLPLSFATFPIPAKETNVRCRSKEGPREMEQGSYPSSIAPTRIPVHRQEGEDEQSHSATGIERPPDLMETRSGRGGSSATGS